MDDVLMRPMFRDAYISKQKQQMKKLKTGGLASIKKFNLGGSVSFTPEEKQAYMLAPVIGSLLQGQKTQGGSFGELVSGTLGDIGRGVSQIPAIGLNIKKIEATGANKRFTTKQAKDLKTNKNVFVTNREIVMNPDRYVPIDKEDILMRQLTMLEKRDEMKEKAEARKTKAKKVSVAEEGLLGGLDMLDQKTSIVANIDKGALTGNFADVARGVSGVIGGTQQLFNKFLNNRSDTDPNYDTNVSAIQSALEKKFGTGFGKLEQANKSNLVGLVYTMLQTQEPGGRYSDKDAQRVLEQLGDSSNPELFITGLNTTVGNRINSAIRKWELATGKNRKELKGTAYEPLLKYTETLKSPKEEKKETKRGKGVGFSEESIANVLENYKPTKPVLTPPGE